MTTASPCVPALNGRSLGKASLYWERLANFWTQLANRQWLAVVLVGMLPMLIRACLLPRYPIPKPMIADEFSHLLIADTFASGRIVNPPLPFSEHFETIYEFQRPVYASIYFPGHGFFMALGQVIAGHPWWGVVASCGLMCGAICWMLAGWVSPSWALVGGLLSVWRFGVLSYWMNSYWGGSVTALGGAIALGALPRLMKTKRPAMAVVLALGLAITCSVRFYEGGLLSIAVGVILLIWLLRLQSWRVAWSVIVPITLVGATAGACLAYYDYRVTGNPLVLPYQLSQRMYGVPRGLIFQKLPPEPPGLNRDQQDVYQWQAELPVGRRFKIQGFHRFYLGRSLPYALLFLLLAWRNRAIYQLLGVCLVVGLGVAIYWFYTQHYIAPITAAVVALVILGLRELWNWKLIPAFIRRCAVAMLLLFDIYWVAHAGMQGELPSHADVHDKFAEKRAALEKQLKSLGGRHLVFAHYGPDHFYRTEWIYNRADIDHADIVWAHPLSREKDTRLVQYLSGRTVWIAEVDASPVKLYKWSPELSDLLQQPESVGSRP